MKIGSSLTTPPLAAPDEKPGASVRAPEATPAGAPAKPGRDAVSLSSAAASMSSLDGAGDFDSAKVDAIRQAIREGRFSVNAEAVADRLIAEASALLGPRSH